MATVPYARYRAIRHAGKDTPESPHRINAVILNIIFFSLVAEYGVNSFWHPFYLRHDQRLFSGGGPVLNR